MADMRTPLKPCPFCGGENLEFYFGDIEGWISHVKCIECDDMIGPMSECKYDDKFEAAEDATIAWNRRAPSQEAETVKALREALTSAANTLESLSFIHDRNPSDALADMPPVEYARHMLFEARQMAKSAHSEARAALSGSAS